VAEASEEKGNASESYGNIEDVPKFVTELCGRPKTAPISESVANMILTVVEIGPTFATMQRLIAENQAIGMRYTNAVANQQAINTLGVAIVTMNCVQVLLDMPANILRSAKS
jgi:Killing trait